MVGLLRMFSPQVWMSAYGSASLHRFIVFLGLGCFFSCHVEHFDVLVAFKIVFDISLNFGTVCMTPPIHLHMEGVANWSDSLC